MKALGEETLALCMMSQSAEASTRVLGMTHPDAVDWNRTVYAWAKESEDKGKDNNSWHDECAPSERNDNVNLHEDGNF
jgi:hypothetical protein